MALRAFIGDAELELPSDFSFPLELHSPMFDLENLQSGDFSMNITFEGTPKNRIAFGFQDELAIVNKAIRYDNFRVEGEDRVITGTLIIQESVEDDFGRVTYDCDFITVLLPGEGIDQSLQDILGDGAQPLGGNTEDIMFAAKVQNNATLSSNGLTGAIMKFVPHYNPQFYGDTNPDFFKDVAEYNRERAYKKGDLITYRLAENSAIRLSDAFYTYLGILNYTLPGGILIPIPFDLETGIYTNGNAHWDGEKYTIPEDGLYKARLVVKHKNTSGGTNAIRFAIYKAIAAGQAIASNSGTFIEDDEVFTSACSGYFEALEGNTIFPTTTGSGFDILEATFEVHKVAVKGAMPPIVFRAIGDVDPGNNPENSPLWEVDGSGVINDWDPIASSFYANQTEFDISENFLGRNRNALVPWMQAHFIIHKVAKAFGYTAKGDYMDDLIEQRWLICSNRALDKSSGRKTFAYIGRTGYLVPAGIAVPIDFDLRSGVYSDVSSRYNPTEKRYENEFAGAVRMRFRCTWKNISGVSNQLILSLRSALSGGSTYIFNDEDQFVDDQEFFTTVLETTVQLSPGDHIYATTTEGTANFFEVISADLEVINLSVDDLNIYTGSVRFGAHVPEMTGREFLQAVRKWKNLHVTFNPFDRTINLNYADKILNGIANAELGPYKIVGGQLRSYPKRRFLMNYGILPEDVFELPVGAVEIDPVDTAETLGLPLEPDEYVLVRNENAYYQSVVDSTTNSMKWIRRGSKYQDLQIDEEGDLQDIRPGLGPLSMVRRVGKARVLMLMPILEQQGASSMFSPDQGHMSLQGCYWIGTDTSTFGSGYPLATAVARNQAGLEVLERNMLMGTIFENNWKRTIQMLVLEERYNATFRFTPQIKQLIDFRRIQLLGHVPIIPIRTKEEIGISQVIEIEARKIKQTEVTVTYIKTIGKGSGGGGTSGSSSGQWNAQYAAVKEGISGLIQAPTNRTFILSLAMPFKGEVLKLYAKTESGTCSLALLIGATPIGGISLAASSTLSSASATSANAFEPGDRMSIQLTDCSEPIGELDFQVELLRTNG